MGCYGVGRGVGWAGGFGGVDGRAQLEEVREGKAGDAFFVGQAGVGQRGGYVFDACLGAVLFWQHIDERLGHVEVAGEAV